MAIEVIVFAALLTSGNPSVTSTSISKINNLCPSDTSPALMLS